MPAKIYHYDLFGKQKDKYDFLKNNSVSTVDWKELDPDDKYHFFVPKDFALQEEWEKGVKVSELFEVFNSGVKTDRDSLFIDQNKNELSKRFHTLLSGDFDMQFRDKYRVKDSGSFKITERIKNKTFDDKFIRKIQYRPFDYQWIYYDTEIISRPGAKAMSHLKNGNVGLITSRQFGGGKHFISFITQEINEISSQPFAPYYNFPLYLYPQNNGDLMQEHKPKPNFNPEIIKQIEAELGMKLYWQAEIGVSYMETKVEEFTPTDLLDYIYAVLHSPSYREKYKEFLKIDFPRVPFGEDILKIKTPRQATPATPQEWNLEFWKLVKLGSKLRKLHLMEGINPLELEQAEVSGEGKNMVEKIRFEKESEPLKGEGFSRMPGGLDFWDYPGGVYLGKVWINDTQYFDNVPEIAWNFYIGGYRPAQKWLKDRKGRELTFDNILHYQKIIYVLGETARVMKLIDNV